MLFVWPPSKILKFGKVGLLEGKKWAEQELLAISPLPSLHWGGYWDLQGNQFTEFTKKNLGALVNSATCSSQAK